MPIVRCGECDNAYRTEEGGCPNPVCYPGARADSVVRMEWEARRRAFVNDRVAKLGYNARRQAEDEFDRHNPRPQPKGRR